MCKHKHTNTQTHKCLVPVIANLVSTMSTMLNLKPFPLLSPCVAGHQTSVLPMCAAMCLRSSQSLGRPTLLQPHVSECCTGQRGDHVIRSHVSTQPARRHRTSTRHRGGSSEGPGQIKARRSALCTRNMYLPLMVFRRTGKPLSRNPLLIHCQ